MDDAKRQKIKKLAQETLENENKAKQLEQKKIEAKQALKKQVDEEVERRLIDIEPEKSKLGAWWTYAVASVLALAVGYFGGREHLKTQIASKIQGDFSEISSALAPFKDIGENLKEKEKKEVDVRLKTNDYFEVSSWDKSFEKGELHSSYVINYTLQNKTNKDIKMIEGTVAFEDLLGKKVFVIEITRDVEIKANQSASLGGEFHTNQFIKSELRLAGMKKNDVKVVLEIKKYVTSDNEVIEL